MNAKLNGLVLLAACTIGCGSVDAPSREVGRFMNDDWQCSVAYREPRGALLWKTPGRLLVEVESRDGCLTPPAQIGGTLLR